MSAAVERLHHAASTVFGKTYELSLTKDYVSRWGMPHAVRELLQNALDSRSPFVYEFVRQEETFELRIVSEFTTLTPQTLLLGSTSKAEDETAIGSFGEGYKIALLVLTRLGYDVEIWNGDLVWKPRFRFSRAFGAELLVIDEAFSPERGRRGLTFVVRGLNETDCSQIKESCLRMQDNIGAIKSTEFGEILLEKPGMLYVGSLFICKTQLKYGYNVKPKYIKLERDRQTVYDWELQGLTAKMWYGINDAEYVAKLISEEVPDLQHAKYDAPEIVKEECYRLFRERNPGAILASSPEDLKEKIKSGMTDVVYAGGGAYYYTVIESKSYKAERPFIEKAQATPTELLTDFFRTYRSEMRTKAIVAFKKLIEDSKPWKRK